MRLDRKTAVVSAKRDLSERLGVAESQIKERGVTAKDFSDMSLGAPTGDEMAAQMISSGWQIDLEADGRKYEYRADKYQLRLVDFHGKNIVVFSS